MVRSLVVLLAALCATGLGHARNEGVTADEIRLGASAVLSGASALTDVNGEASVTATANGAIGSYTVSVNATYQMQPYAILVVTSLGEVGDSARQAVSRRALRAEVDLARFVRSSPGVANPNYRRLTSYQDLGGL